jgi:hypothetical protein
VTGKGKIERREEKATWESTIYGKGKRYKCGNWDWEKKGLRWKVKMRQGKGFREKVEGKGEGMGEAYGRGGGERPPSMNKQKFNGMTSSKAKKPRSRRALLLKQGGLKEYFFYSTHEDFTMIKRSPLHTL